MEERDPLDPGVDDLPNDGKCLDVQVREGGREGGREEERQASV